MSDTTLPTTTKPRKLSNAQVHFFKDAVQNKLSRKEIRDYYRVWHELFPNGQATQEGFETSFKVLLRKGDIDVKTLFLVMDQDKSGTISFEEFLFFVSVADSNEAKDMAELFFNVFDVDGDSYLTREELRTSLTLLYKMHGKRIDQDARSKIDQRIDLLFEIADVNHDNQLSLEEVLSACEKDSKFFVF